MKLTSSAFEYNLKIPAVYTCDGQNINPPLEISDVPENSKSLVLIIDDPDAPVGDWVHWVITNIDPKTTSIKENSVPKNSVLGTTSFGKNGYGGPCPPSGNHRYFFKLYALDLILEVDESIQKNELLTIIEGHTLDYAELIGTYQRN